MPKCLHPPCDRLVDDALYCDEHKYIPHWTTNITRVEDRTLSNETEWIQAPSRSLPSETYSPPHRAPVLGLVLVVLILALLAVGVIVILKLVL